MSEQRNNHVMTGDVQGFDIPRGCLMTTGLIILPILVFGIAVLMLS